jgi:SpoVK/Ycf46/Vps4 family AAA+-type ATPase
MDKLVSNVAFTFNLRRHIKGPELYSKWVGDSEKAVRTLFARARAAAPSVIFLDELDGLVGQRSDGGAGGEPSNNDRLLTQLLGEMDGLQGGGVGGGGGGDSGVAVVAATNRPDLVDPALLRPGRFDRLLFIPPPAHTLDRLEILQVKLRNTPLGPDVNLDMLAAATGGYTGADLAAVCREAAMAALEEDLGRGLHSSAFWLNISAFCGIGGACRGYSGGFHEVRGYQGVFRVRKGSG